MTVEGRSYSEERVKDALDVWLPDRFFIDNCRPPFMGGLELDRFYPDLMLAIEVDGARWHRGRKAKFIHRLKRLRCRVEEVYLARIPVGPHGVSAASLLILRRRVLNYVEGHTNPLTDKMVHKAKRQLSRYQ